VHQVGVLTNPFDEDGSRAGERVGRRRHALLVAHVCRGDFLGQARRIRDEGVGERFQACLARDLGLGSALRLVRQVQVFELRLRRGALDGVTQLLGQCPLLVDRGEHCRAPVLEFAKVAEPLFKVAQLRIVEGPRDLLPISRDEGHRCAAIEQADRGGNLPCLDTEFLGDECIDLLCHGVGLRT
jgi:hypothetical protein